MKKHLTSLLLSVLFLLPLASFAQYDRGKSINVRYNNGYQTCNYTLSVTAEIKNTATGAIAMTPYQTATFSPNQLRTFNFSFSSGYTLTDRYIFKLQPDNGGACSIAIDYTSGTPSSIYGCTCTGNSGPVIVTYWYRSSPRNFEFSTTGTTGTGG